MRQDEIWDMLYKTNPRLWRGKSNIPKLQPGKALDLGCGNGKTVSALMDAGYDTYGVDFSNYAITQCKNTFKYPSKFILASIVSLPFEDSSFEYITAVHVLENLDDNMLKPAISEIRRVLIPNGHVFVRVFTPYDMRSTNRIRGGIFYRYYNVESIVNMFRGFDVIYAKRIDRKTRFGAIRSQIECLFHLQ